MPEGVQGFNLKPIITVLRKNLHLYFIFIAIALSIAWVINRYSTKIYRVGSSVLIKDRQNSQISPEDYLGNVMAFRTQNAIQNEMIRIKSNPILEAAAKRIHYDITYFSVGKFNTSELYKTCPFIVKGYVKSASFYEYPFLVRFKNNRDFTLEFKNKNQSKNTYINSSMGKTINTEYWNISIVPNDSLANDDDNAEGKIQGIVSTSELYKFYFNNPKNMGERLGGKVKVDAEDKTAIMNLNTTESVPLKGIEFLNALMDCYIEDNVRQKSQNAENTITFIDGQLKEINLKMAGAEGDLTDFKNKTGTIDFSAKAKLMYERVIEIEKTREIVNFQIRNLELLKTEILTKKEVNNIGPSLMDNLDPILAGLIQKLIEFNQQYSSLASVQRKNSPDLNQIEKQISSIKSAIIDNIESQKKSKSAVLITMDSNLGTIQADLNSLPLNEIQFLIILFNDKIIILKSQRLKLQSLQYFLITK